MVLGVLVVVQFAFPALVCVLDLKLKFSVTLACHVVEIIIYPAALDLDLHYVCLVVLGL